MHPDMNVSQELYSPKWYNQVDVPFVTRSFSVGAEGFELECGPWNCLGNKALVQDSYTPDFDAVGVAPLRVLRIRRPAFLACLEATSLQPVVNYQVSHLTNFSVHLAYAHIQRLTYPPCLWHQEELGS